MYDLSLVSNGWDIFITSAIVLAGAIFAFSQRRVFAIPVAYALILYFWHIANSVAYALYTQNSGGDALVYFLHSKQIDEGFKPGTIAIQYLTAPFSDYLALPYIAVTIIFGIFGYLGIIFLASSLRNLASNKAKWVKRIVFIIPFLPGINFWSSSIGKDSVVLFGIGLSCWAALDLKGRSFSLFFAVFVIFIARPHIAGVLLITVVIVMIFYRNFNIVYRVGLLVILVPIAATLLTFALNYAGIEKLGTAADLSSYFEERQGHNLDGGSSVDISAMSFPVRMFTYLFRPLFFDAGGILGIVASLENLFLLIIVISTLFRLRKRKLSLPSSLMIFLVIFFSISLVILANTTANLGIALRQKWMMVPMLLMIFVLLQRNVEPRRDVPLPRFFHISIIQKKS